MFKFVAVAIAAAAAVVGTPVAHADPALPVPVPSIVLPTDFILYPGGWVGNIVIIQPSPPPEIILPPGVWDPLPLTPATLTPA